MRIDPNDTAQLAARFADKFIPEPNSGCWLWTARLEKSGYGSMSRGGKIAQGSQGIGAHRASWLIHRGPIPRGLFVCHHCDVRACVNPDHLYLGDCKKNLSDAASRKRMAWGERHGRAKLTAEKVRVIRRMRQHGFLHREIAAEVGVSRGAVTCVLRGVVWGNLP